MTAYPARADVVAGRLEVRAPFALRDALKVAGGWWDPGRKAWTFEATGPNAFLIRSTVARLQTSPAFDAWVDMAEFARVNNDNRYTREAPEIPGLVVTRELHSWQHQRQAYADAMSRDATMLAIGMGGGKSRVAIGAILTRDVRRTLILCPHSVVPVWPAEFEKHVEGGMYAARVWAPSGNSVAQKTDAARNFLDVRANGQPAIIVTNYDSARLEPFRSWSLGAGFDMVVLDESQRIKSPGGITSRYAAALAKRARYRLTLSGTPASHSPLDLYGQFRFLDSTIYGTSFVRFRHRYAVMGGFQNHEVIGYQNVEEFSQKYHSITFQVGREVLDLPEATEVTRYCELGYEGRRVYRELERNFYAKLDSGEITTANAMTALLRLQQLTGGYLEDDAGVLNQVDHAKRDLLAETLEEIGPEPVVVFCRFRRDLDTVRAVAGDDTLELSGRVNELARWQAGEGRVLAVQIQAGSVGISLVRSAYTILFSVGYSLSDYEQALARVHRPGQERPVTIVKLITRDTADERVYKALAERRDVIETMLARQEEVRR